MVHSCLRQFLNVLISPSPKHFGKGHSIPPITIHPRQKFCLAGEDWHSVQMSKKLKQFLTLSVPTFTFPISTTSRTVRGSVSGDWWRTEPFRHHSLLKVWPGSHITPSWSVVKRCSLEWSSTQYISLKDKIQYFSPLSLRGWQFNLLTEHSGSGWSIT